MSCNSKCQYAVAAATVSVEVSGAGSAVFQAAVKHDIKLFDIVYLLMHQTLYNNISSL